MCRLKAKKKKFVALALILIFVAIFIYKCFENASPVVSSIEWKMFDRKNPGPFSERELQEFEKEPILVQENELSPAICKINSQKLINGVPKDFQRRLLGASRLNCYSGREGVFHNKYASFLNVLAAYADNHSAMSSDPNLTRTLVWQCPPDTLCGGLSDRLRGMSYALLLAVLSHRRLVLSWESATERTYFKPNMINWADDYLEKILNYDKSETINMIFPDAIQFNVSARSTDPFLSETKDNLHKYLNYISGKRRLIIMRSNVEVFTILSNFTTYNQQWLIDGLNMVGLYNLSNNELDDILGIVFRYLFKLDSELVKELSRAKVALRINDYPYTAVHLRTGFVGNKLIHESHYKLIRKKDDWKSVLKCAISKADQFLGQNRLIFLATDSKLVKEMAIKTYGARFRTLNNSLLHIDKINKAKMPPHKVKEGVLHSLIDLLLLAESYVQIRGDSGYSWVAGLLCGIPNEHLISTGNCQMDNLSIIHY